jgi:hypothetical protein
MLSFPGSACETAHGRQAGSFVTVDRVDFLFREVFAMAPRLALLSLILAFGVSVAFATVTTVRQVHHENASAPVHSAHS